jgi:methionine-rich copper-binding protein CopC
MRARSVSRPRRWAFVAALLGLVVAAPPAGAHALLLEAMPADGATVSAVPSDLVLRFNSRIEHELSKATLVAEADGQRSALAVVADAPPDRFVCALPASLAPGRYTIEWQVLSVDGHRVAGKLGFAVGGPG